ncbi:MAG: HDIG domain-containing protein [Chloroflexi bacterium]|nr:HDIG domain-containing protein [Chloroflexota bacterium]
MKGTESGSATPRPAQQEHVFFFSWHKYARALLLAVLLVLVLSITLVPYPSSDQVSLKVGEPSPVQYKSPRRITFASEVQTRAARELASSQVKEVYRGPDISIAISQVRLIQNINAYITALRNDTFINNEERALLIAQLPNLTLQSSTIDTILQFSESDWYVTYQEATRVLDLVMRDEIRENQVSDAKSLIARYTSYSLSDQERSVVLDLSGALVVANTFYDAAQTDANRQAAADEVAPVLWTIQQGESIVREGEIITDLTLESLKALGIQGTEVNWQVQLGMVGVAIILVFALSYYIYCAQPLLLDRPRRELLLVLLISAFAAAARLLIPGHTLTPYIFPIAALAMFTALLLDLNLAILISGIGAVLVGYHSGGSLELVVYAFLGGIVGALAVYKMDSLLGFLRAMGYLILTNTAVIVSFRLSSQLFDTAGLVQLLISAIGNAVLAASLTFIGFAFIGRLFGIATSLQLLDLARPTHPLLRQLVVNAPGTYHHSIIISNMAERAAIVIGADSLLARVGSYYHDIGKTLHPYFFVENQGDGPNPHDQLDPKTSAEIIISHVTEGIELARKYDLPEKVVAFIPEHHGTTLVAYFYRMAVQESEADYVDESSFRYHGPKPQSKETAIVMLADSIEALVRANHPNTHEEVERLIRQIINDRLVSGQLDECDLTLRDLDKIRQAFAGVLLGIFHPRIKYPEKAKQKDSSTPPADDRMNRDEKLGQSVI